MAEKKSASPTGIDLYSRFAFAGAVCCSVTHTALVPVDVVKTRIQLSPEIYNKGMLGGFRQIVQSEGAMSLTTGWAPTAAGYFVQGALKFGGYEFFKKQFVTYFGPDKSSDYRTGIYLASSAMAEFFADIALCPAEAARIRLVSDPSFASSLPAAASRLLREQGVLKGFYSGFGPILFKQVPYTMAKFVVYERIAEAIYQVMPPKDKLSPSTVTGINLASGLGAGLVAAVISQPADTLLSKVNKQKGKEGESITRRLINLGSELGVKGLFTGLGARLVMVGTLTAFQLASYGDIKRDLNATGGTEIQVKKSK